MSLVEATQKIIRQSSHHFEHKECYAHALLLCVCSLASSIDMATPSTSSVSKWQTDWSKCCLCQQDKKEELKSPPSSYQPEQDGYTNIATNALLFQALNALPVMLDPARLDEGGGIDQTLRKNNANITRAPA